MEIKNIARIGFTTRWALEHQGNLAIGDRLLGKVIIDDESIHAIVHEELTHRCAREWSDVLIGRIVTRRSSNDNGIFHCAGSLKDSNGASNVRILLTNGNID